jgi:hypothetical protein
MYINTQINRQAKGEREAGERVWEREVKIGVRQIE